jgi:ubiquitin-conjugating enzyme E2 Q
MALGGFGPSIEYAILTQPYVVDLLISFCYAGAINRRIREYPTGMSLSVPSAPDIISTSTPYSAQPLTQNKTVDRLTESYNVKYDQNLKEVVFDEENSCPLRRGDWIVLTTVIDRVSTHHRVIDVLGPTAKLSSVVVNRSSAITVRDNFVANTIVTNTAKPTAGPVKSPTPAVTPPLSVPSPMVLQVYDKNFDDLTVNQKCECIKMLLETIPSIKEMKKYLRQQQKVAEPSLRTWIDRISPAALGLLRWIIASNRSCIVQVDMCPGQEENDELKAIIRQDEKVSNMSGWVQFRFAQGAPDKETRFNKALGDMQETRNRDYPTLFAWHGSPLQNWHSIIRSGLDFKETHHGRAYGHGCYHSLDQATSLTYAGYHGGVR